jgi:hypothetical protein
MQKFPAYEWKFVYSIYDLIDSLIIYSFMSSSRIFHLYWDVIITGEGLQNLGLCSALRALKRVKSLSCHTCCNMGSRFTRGLNRTTTSFSRLLRHTRGRGGPTLSRILTGTAYVFVMYVSSLPQEHYQQNFTQLSNHAMYELDLKIRYKTI